MSFEAMVLWKDEPTLMNKNADGIIYVNYSVRIPDLVGAFQGFIVWVRKFYWCVELLDMPCAEVAEKYGVTTNNIYQVVSRIKKGLKSDGKRIYEDLYHQAA